MTRSSSRGGGKCCGVADECWCSHGSHHTTDISLLIALAADQRSGGEEEWNQKTHAERPTTQRAATAEVARDMRGEWNGGKPGAWLVTTHGAVRCIVC